MSHALTDLGRNLAAGLRLALLMPVTRLAFRIDLVQLLRLFVASAVIDIATEWIRLQPDARFSFLGAGGEIFIMSVLLLSAALQAVVFRQRALALAIPVMVLAAYPAIPLVHVALQMVLAFRARNGSWVPDAFELAVSLWSALVLIRVIAVALVPAQPHRVVRILAGGLMLALPVAVAPLLIPTQAWWHSLSAPISGRYPSPASEPVLAAQQTLLDEALSNLDDESPGKTDLYFVGFVGDGHDDDYRQDMLAAQRAMDEHWDMGGRAVSLVSSPATLLDTPIATVTNLRETLKEVAAAINPEEDVVMLYLAGPAARDGTLDVYLPPLELLPLSPAVLRTVLDESGIVWRIVVVSSCHADAFVEALKNETTLILAAAGDDKTGGCAVVDGSTRLGAALFGGALPRAESLQQAFEAAQAESQRGAAPGAQLFIGSEIERKLKELDRGRANRAAGRTV